jgi:hypothetical protein
MNFLDYYLTHVNAIITMSALQRSEPAQGSMEASCNRPPDQCVPVAESVRGEKIKDFYHEHKPARGR